MSMQLPPSSLDPLEEEDEDEDEELLPEEEELDEDDVDDELVDDPLLLLLLDDELLVPEVLLVVQVRPLEDVDELDEVVALLSPASSPPASSTPLAVPPPPAPKPFGASPASAAQAWAATPATNVVNPTHSQPARMDSLRFFVASRLATRLIFSWPVAPTLPDEGAHPGQAPVSESRLAAPRPSLRGAPPGPCRD
jgi:hypothetical protein